MPSPMQQQVNDFSMWVEDQGEGLPLVLVHAFPLDHHVWKDVRGALIRDYRVVLFDMRGFGRSASTPPPYSMELLAGDLRALLDQLEIERAVLGGISMGGYVALSFFARHPERVAGLALVDSRATPDTPEGKQSREEMAELARQKGSAAVVEGMLPKLLGTTSRETRPDLVERVKELGAQASVDGIVGALVAMRDRRDSRPLLAEVRVPALVVVGEQDALTPRADSEAMAQALPDSLLKVIPGAGHLSPLERPAEVTLALRQLLSRIG